MKKHQHTVTKIYRDFPAAHRQPKHDGHCRMVHGHNWGFDITFACQKLDANGFVVDVGKLKKVKDFLTDKFDHTLLLNETDPLLLQTKNWPPCKLVVVPNCGMEGLAKLVFDELNGMIKEIDNTKRGLEVVQVICWEDSKNSATYA